MIKDQIVNRIEELGLDLPASLQVPKGLSLPFQFCKVSGTRVFLSGHLPLQIDGTIWPVTGKVGDQISIDEAYEAARRTTLAMLSSLQKEIGSLDRISNWLRIFGMVNTAPGFTHTANVMNGCSELLIDIFGSEIGSHTRSAVGFAEIPFNCPIEIEAELEIKQ